MPTRRKLILGGAALLAACGEPKAPKVAMTAPVVEPIDLTLPAMPAYGLAIIAQARRLWDDMDANLVMANDDATLARGFNSGLIEIGGMALDRFLFWRSGGTKMQFVGWADTAKGHVYAAREDLPDQADIVGRFIAGLKAADAWMRANAADAAKLIAAQIETADVDPSTLPGLIAGTGANRAALAPAADGECQALKDMRPIDAAMRDKDVAGHVAFLPEIIAASAAAAWAK